MWDKFISGFCKVEFLCFAGSPNWLGWGVLGIGLIVALFLLVVIVLFWLELTRGT
tara:strand:- start:242 stop:406 length:165 start_codon:yes stop_codon:yes gene_type:complete